MPPPSPRSTPTRCPSAARSTGPLCPGRWRESGPPLPPASSASGCAHGGNISRWRERVCEVLQGKQAWGGFRGRLRMVCVEYSREYELCTSSKNVQTRLPQTSANASLATSAASQYFHRFHALGRYSSPTDPGTHMSPMTCNDYLLRSNVA